MINQLLSTSFKTLGICGNCDRTGETFHLTPDVAEPTSDRLYSFKLNATRLMALGADMGLNIFTYLVSISMEVMP